MDRPQKMSRRVKLLLVGSLGLNLLFVGIFAGAAFRHVGAGGPGGGKMQNIAAPYVQALPRAQRQALRERLRKDGVFPSKKERRAVYQHMLEGLRADPFDVNALGAMISDQGQTMQRLQGAAQAGWLDVVSQMSAEERFAYADALEERLKRRRGWGRKKHRE